METEIDGFYFSSLFDSGNLARVHSVKLTGQANPHSPEESPDLYPNLRPEYRFHLWTCPDAAGTPYENSNRTWFHFAMQSRRRGCVVQFVLQNLNKQMRLYTQGMAPVFCVKPGSSDYERIPYQPWFWLEEEQFFMSFIHVTPSNSCHTTYFAFTYPYSYEKLQQYLLNLDIRYSHCQYLTTKSARDQTFYSHELLCNSLEGRKIDLLTVTSCHGMSDQREPHLPCLFPLKQKRPPHFEGKRVIFLTARVHPGETPSSYVLQGFLDFLLSDTDVSAFRLRKKYVFKLIPMLNPDGVAMGHYRTDSRGINLNRVYIDPVFELHPAIFAVKSLILYHHIVSRKKRISSPLRVNEKKSPPLRVLSKISAVASGSRKLEVVGKKLQKENSYCVYETDDGKTMELGKTPGSSKSCMGMCNGFEQGETSTGLRASLPVILSEAMKTLSDSGTSPEIPADSETSQTIAASVYDSDGAPIEFKPEVIRVVLPEDFGEDETGRGLEELKNQDTPYPALPPDPLPPPSNRIAEVPTGMVDAFTDEWGTFVSSVLKIRGELSQTLKELQQTFSVSVTENTSDCLVPPELNRLLPEREVTAEVLSAPSPDEVVTVSSGSDKEMASGSTACRKGPTYGTHLVVPLLSAEIPPNESGVAIYVDMHGHASRRGCFMYGNYFEEAEEKVDCMLLPKLLSINCLYFDFNSCVFSRKNMYCPDRKDGTTKLGCGRVAIHTMTRITRSYTLECNYNTGVLGPTFPSKSNTTVMQSTPPQSTYKPQVYEQVGRSLAISILDTEDSPRSGSRLGVAECRTTSGVRDWLRQYVRLTDMTRHVPSHHTRSHSTTRALFNAARQAMSVVTITPLRRHQHHRHRQPFTARSSVRAASAAKAAANAVFQDGDVNRVANRVIQTIKVRERKQRNPGDGETNNLVKKKGKSGTTAKAKKKKSGMEQLSNGGNVDRVGKKGLTRKRPAVRRKSCAAANNAVELPVPRDWYVVDELPSSSKHAVSDKHSRGNVGKGAQVGDKLPSKSQLSVGRMIKKLPIKHKRASV